MMMKIDEKGKKLFIILMIFQYRIITRLQFTYIHSIYTERTIYE